MAVAFEVEGMREVLPANDVAILADHLERLYGGRHDGALMFAQLIRDSEDVDAPPIVVNVLSGRLLLAALLEIQRDTGMTDSMRALHARCADFAGGRDVSER